MPINWSTFHTVDVSDQSSRLPDSSKFNLVKLKTTLDNPDDFDAWYKAIYTSLNNVDCAALISSTIPRPQVDQFTGEAQNWWILSKQVRGWIEASIDDHLASQINNALGFELILADDYMKAVKTVMQADGPLTKGDRVAELFKICASDYDSLSSFLLEFNNRLSQLWDMKIEVAPMTALYFLTSVVNQVDGDITRKLIDLTPKAESITKTEYYKCIRDIREILRSYSTKPFVGSTVSHTGESKKDESNKDNKKKRPSNNPPKGVSPDDHAKKQRESTTKPCGHCGTRTHSAKTCWFLCPDLRPEGWKSRNGHQMYGSTRKETQRKETQKEMRKQKRHPTLLHSNKVMNLWLDQRRRNLLLSVR